MVVHALGRVTDSSRYRIHSLDQCSRAVVGRSRKSDLEVRLGLYVKSYESGDEDFLFFL